MMYFVFLTIINGKFWIIYFIYHMDRGWISCIWLRNSILQPLETIQILKRIVAKNFGKFLSCHVFLERVGNRMDILMTKVHYMIINEQQNSVETITYIHIWTHEFNHVWFSLFIYRNICYGITKIMRNSTVTTVSCTKYTLTPNCTHTVNCNATSIFYLL